MRRKREAETGKEEAGRGVEGRKRKRRERGFLKYGIMFKNTLVLISAFSEKS